MRIKKKPVKPERLLNIEVILEYINNDLVDVPIEDYVAFFQGLKIKYSDYKYLRLRGENYGIQLYGTYDEPETKYLSRLARYGQELTDYNAWYKINEEKVLEQERLEKEKIENTKLWKINNLKAQLRKLEN